MHVHTQTHKEHNRHGRASLHTQKHLFEQSMLYSLSLQPPLSPFSYYHQSRISVPYWDEGEEAEEEEEEEEADVVPADDDDDEDD